MSMIRPDVEWYLSKHHECPNVRKGLRLLLRLIQAVDAQSDGWAYWRPAREASMKLQELLKSVGNLAYGTHDKISDADLKKAITPIRSMVTRQKRIQAKYGNKFDFDVDAALRD